MNSMLSSGRPFTSLFTSTGCSQHAILRRQAIMSDHHAPAVRQIDRARKHPDAKCHCVADTYWVARLLPGVKEQGIGS